MGSIIAIIIGSLIFFIFLSDIIRKQYFVDEKMKSDDKLIEAKWESIGFAILGFFIFWIGARHYIGIEERGSLFEKWEYSSYYYVNIYPEDSDSKNYRLKAKIDASGKKYSLKEVYWPNGGHSSFEDCSLDYEYGDPICEDDQGRDWKIKVDQKA